MHTRLYWTSRDFYSARKISIHHSCVWLRAKFHQKVKRFVEIFNIIFCKSFRDIKTEAFSMSSKYCGMLWNREFIKHYFTLIQRRHFEYLVEKTSCAWGCWQNSSLNLKFSSLQNLKLIENLNGFWEIKSIELFIFPSNAPRHHGFQYLW